MSLRVRKLARELGREPSYVLALLQHLGFSRFRSVQDMLPDRVVGQVRSAVASGVVVQTVSEVPVMRVQPNELPPTASQADDLMASLVPGVVPLSGERKPTARPPAPELAPLPVETPPSGDPDEGRLESRWSELLTRERALQRAEEAHAMSVAAHETATREAEHAAAVASAPMPDASSTPGDEQRLIDWMALRGIVLEEEQSAALHAFVRHPSFRKHLLQLPVSKASKLLELMDSQVVLTEGPPPEGLLGYATVPVASERSEWPSEPRLAKSVAALSSELLLRGFRRIVLAGLTELEIVCLRHRLDPRIDWRSSSIASLTSDTLAGESGWAADACVVWAKDIPKDLRAWCQEHGVWFVQREPDQVLARIDGLCEALRQE